MLLLHQLEKSRKLQSEIPFLKASKNCGSNEHQANYNDREKRITPSEMMITGGFRSRDICQF